MNKRLKATVCAVVVTCSLLALQGTLTVRPIGVDVVSAATAATPAPAPSHSNTGATNYTSNYRSTNGSVLLKVGSVGDAVKSLQTSLNNIGYKLDADGFFGPLTLNAVEDFQKSNGLVVDGIVGPNTYGVLNPTTPTTTLRVGNTGSDVTFLQKNLNKAGYNITADGIFGPLTLNAVKDFQKSSGLAVDGLAGPKTFAALNSKVTAVVTPAPAQPAPQPPVDVVSSASIVDNADAFQKAIVPKSKGGKWIIAITKDLTTDKALVLDGEFVNTKTPPAVQRKIALYAQDDKHVVTARYTLTAPKLIILSPNASVEHGNFKGDLYVSAPNFKLINAKIDGNVYFTNKAAKDTFTIADKDGDQKTVITGKQEVKLTTDVDVVTSASIVNNNDAFEKATSKDGKWIIAVLDNLTFSKEIVLDGTFNNTKTPPAQQRKIALYAHDDNKVTDGRFMLTAPKLTVNSPTASIQHGVFKGDVYVSAPNFSLVDAIVDGNIYFTSSEYKATFVMDADSVITGQQLLTTK